MTHPMWGDFILMYPLKYDKKEKASNRRLKWHVRCICGKEEDVPEYYMIRPHSPKTNCGCKRKTIRTEHPTEYGIWNMMHVRCYNPTHVAYKHYGGRGIHVCPEWHKDSPDGKGFDRFIEYIGKRPSMKHTIDRVDNNGSYYPYQADGVTRQVRWATSEVQRQNQRTPEQLAADKARYNGQV
jgi:hypothetical protein